MVNASTYLSASLVGCWLSDPLNEYFFGRRAAICISALIILASIIGSAATNHWTQLLACRILLGIGMGSKASVVPVFVSYGIAELAGCLLIHRNKAAEVAPAHIRGSLVMNWFVEQCCDAHAILMCSQAAIRRPGNLLRLHRQPRRLPGRSNGLALANRILSLAHHSLANAHLRLSRVSSVLDETPEVPCGV